MEKNIKTSDKVFKLLVRIFMVLIVISLILFGVNKYLDKQEKKQLEQQAIKSIPIIEERISKIIDDNTDIYDIKTHFEYDGINFIELYVMDTWFNSTDIQKKRFANDVRDNIKAILFEEGFIKADDRVGIYVYSVDGISLAEDGIGGEIKLKD
ncbi:hypothetical protein KQI41_01220 [Tissierella pigra]|uniref:hypothetical protein n=1 Tax=Tissierella pigra TaxID=2607614 RepID=UPI001C0F6F1F|nr:hypothetical protein [Tissierella pigra]MBU5425016.1 hypothetical protein [Tissierella pigra]